MHTFKKISLSLLCIAAFAFSGLKAQDLVYSNNKSGFNVSANFALGTHFRRVGITATLFYVNNQFQANSEIRAYINLKGPGPALVYSELVLSQGFVYGYGAKQSLFNPFISSVSNQTGYLNSFAYSYNAYFNKIKTCQQTGILSIEVNHVSLISENDILARSYYDRFRTAAFLLQYQYEDKFQAAINCSMWTGQFRKKKECSNPAFYQGCYMDTTGGYYTHLSHGLLSLQFKYNIGLSQNLQANLGVDAEQVRNAMQNKFIHDMKFIPKKWNKAKNCHIPMLDEKGNQYLYEEGQKIRKASPYLNVFSNANVFY